MNYRVHPESRKGPAMIVHVSLRRTHIELAGRE